MIPFCCCFDRWLSLIPERGVTESAEDILTGSEEETVISPAALGGFTVGLLIEGVRA